MLIGKAAQVFQLILLLACAGNASAQTFEEELRSVLYAPTLSTEGVGDDSVDDESVQNPPGRRLTHFSEMKTIATGAVMLYQVSLSETDARSCTFHPSCSHFGVASLERFGAVRGVLMTADRVMRCHGLPTMLLHYPFNPAIERFMDSPNQYDELSP